MKKNLRIVEKKVLRQLEIDSRMAFSKIGKNIRKSQQQVCYTVNALLEKEILNGFFTIIDYSKLDIINFCVFFKVNYINKGNLDNIIKFIKNNMHSSYIAATSGRFDLVCSFLTKNPSQFNKTLKNIVEEFSKELVSYEVLTIIVNKWYGRKYLFEKQDMPELSLFGGDREPEDVNEIDLKILYELSADARVNSAEIANKLKTTPKTVIKHIRELQTRKIIKGFKPLVNPRRMNHISRLLLIKYHNISINLEDQFVKYMKIHPNIVSISKSLGGCDIIITVEAANSIEYRKIEMEIREKFSELIHTIESYPLYKVYKKNYFPEFLLKNQKT